MGESYDEIALKVIRIWESGVYQTGTQCIAALQVAISDALRKAARG